MTRLHARQGQVSGERESGFRSERGRVYGPVRVEKGDREDRFRDGPASGGKGLQG